MASHVLDQLRRRGLSGAVRPIVFTAMLVWIAVCALPAPAVVVTYGHMLYDDEIRNVWKNGSWRAEVDPNNKTNVYNGSSSMAATLEGKGALCFIYDKGWDLTRFYALVGWIHGGTEGGQNLRLVLIDTEGNVLPSRRGVRLATPAHIQGGAIPPGRWQFFVIPMSELKPGYKNTARIAFYNGSKEAMPTFYLDDVGFTAQRVPLFATLQPKPKEEKGVKEQEAEKTTSAIYTDALANDWLDWSWNTNVDLANQEHPAEGKCAILVEQEPGGGLTFGREVPVPAEKYRAFAFTVHGGPAGGQRLNVSFFDENGELLGTLLLDDQRYIFGGGIVGGQWQQVHIPLADVGAAAAKVKKIAIINAGRDKILYYIDAVSFIE